MVYSPIEISNYFLSVYGEEHNGITPMKLVKLVYISHGWYLGLTGNALIDENPEAWKYGPVIPSVYHYFKSYGRKPIKTKEFYPDPQESLPEDIKEFLDKIWEVYGPCDGLELSAKTHQVGTPWYITWNEIIKNKEGRVSEFGFYSTQIPDNLIKDYYQQKLLLNKHQA